VAKKAGRQGKAGKERRPKGAVERIPSRTPSIKREERATKRTKAIRRHTLLTAIDTASLSAKLTGFFLVPLPDCKFVLSDRERSFWYAFCWPAEELEC
jgi:hypothetical protein